MHPLLLWTLLAMGPVEYRAAFAEPSSIAAPGPLSPGSQPEFVWDRIGLLIRFPGQTGSNARFSLGAKNRTVHFRIAEGKEVLWGVKADALNPGEAKVTRTGDRIEVLVPWVLCSPLGGRPEPGALWSFVWSDDPAAVLRFERKGWPATSMGPLPWSGTPDPGLPFQTRPLFPKTKLSFPVCVAPIPGTDAYLVSTQPGPYAKTTVVRFRAGKPEAVENALELDAVIYDMAFHPNFAKNRFLYIGSNGQFGSKDPHKTRITRFRLEEEAPWRIDPATATTIIEWESNGHNGGAICFGKDGMLYVTSGDGTSDSDINLAGQDTSKKLAKVLRIDVDRAPPGKPYAVPPDNPWVGREGFVPEAWAMGLRNPWRITHDPATGNIWVGNNGQDLWETVYLIRKGDNYGWSVLEGSHDFYPERKSGPRPFAPPAAEHHHREARSLTGGVVYHGKRFPQLAGHYLYGDHSTGKIWSLAPPRPDAQFPLRPNEIADTSHQITAFAIDHDGEILILDHLSGLQTLEPNPMAGKRGNFPQLLSQSGMFQTVREHTLRQGIIPYEVNSPLWSDGAHKARFVFLPDRKDETGRMIPQAATHVSGAPWNFPEGTVIIKSFALERQPGKPESRHWIETRFLVKEDSEWVGYTYAWNQDGTDATLVGADGENRVFPVGQGQQTWRYPSRAECMVCHSRAAGFVLGLCDLQLNRDIEVLGKKVNQIAWWESQGRLEQPVGDQRLAALKALAQRATSPQQPKEAWISERLPEGGFPVTSRLVDIDPTKLGRLPNPTQPASGSLEERVRAYLHVNCAVCHVEAGGGNSKIRLDWAAKLSEMNLLDTPPSHHHFGLPQARLIAPGFPERSVLLHRMAMTEAGKMPPVARSVVDREAVKLVEDWIRALGAGPSATRAPAPNR